MTQAMARSVTFQEDIHPSPPSTNGIVSKQPGDTGHHAACRFYVEISKGNGKSEIQALFTEVSGMQVEMQTTDYEEGGMNNFVHRLPGRLKVGNVTFKHGMTKSMDFLNWAMRAALEKPMERRHVTVFLYDSLGKPVVRWHFENAFPVKWVGPQFTADSTSVAIESVELAHEGIRVDSQ
jgi:phage tail-like protein